MRVLSLFDGISVGRLALATAGVPVSTYYASEIDPFCTSLTARNHPDVVQLGDVKTITRARVGQIDLLIGGSPCQGFSYAGQGLNFSDPRSSLFFEFVRLLEELRPTYFMLENVIMQADWRDVISSHLGVTPRLWDASAVSWQSRPRYWWGNFPLEITRFGRPSTKPVAGFFGAVRGRRNRDATRSYTRGQQRLECRADLLCNCITSVEKDTVVLPSYTTQSLPDDRSLYRYLTHSEREVLMGLPVGYTFTPFARHGERLLAIGNSWHHDVVSQLFEGLLC